MPQTYTVKKGETLSGIGAKLGVDWRKITGYRSGDPNLIYPGETLNLPGVSPVKEKYEALKESMPGEPLTLPGLGEEVKDRALGAVTPGEEPETPQDKMIADLTKRLTAYTTGPTLIEEKKRLEEEKGVLGMRERVGSFEEEMATTQTLLDQLEGDITQRTREFLVAEPARRRLLAVERKPLLEQLGIAERGLAATTGRLARTEQDILTELGLIEKEKTMPMDLFERELNIRSKIQELTTKDIPNVTTSQFNDEGDLTIVTQDPTTGAFSTQTMKGIGKKAGEYEQFSTIQNAAGDVTVIGIKRDGTTENLGVFKGAGKAVEPEEPYGKYTTRLKEEISSLYSGRYGREGSREKIIDILKREFPGEDVSGDIYSKVPNGYEESIKGEEEPTELTRMSISQLYGVPDNNERSGILGAFGAGKTNSQKIDDIMDIIKKYQDVGYSDEDILKLMREEE